MEEALETKDGRAGEGGVVVVDPLEVAGWDDMVMALPGSTVFHRSGWARVLHETYGHRPCYFCRFEGGRLSSVLAVMEVSSRLTGRRGVGLPFTDICTALRDQRDAAGGSDVSTLYQHAMEHGHLRGWRYLECRGTQGWSGATPSIEFWGHVVELSTENEAMFQKLGSSVRRGVRKAEGSGVRVDFSRSARAMEVYYGLHCRTRKRHGVPPQPKKFFENIARYIFSREQGFVAIARSSGGRPVAGAICLYSGREAIYKFGASDDRFQHLRPNNLVVWEAMEELAALGCSNLHLGRTSLGNPGLRRFKLGFGAREGALRYGRYDVGLSRFVRSADHSENWFNRILRLLPSSLLQIAGQVVYPALS